jgi:trimethylamine--corrinoid protein Co-methyltransferase
VRVESERTAEVFAAGGADVDGDRVRLPGDLVQKALDSAPSVIDIHDRRGEAAFRIGGGAETRFGIGVTSLNYQDPVTEDITPFVRKHMETTVRLGQSLAEFDVISTVGVVQDTPADLGDLYGTLEMVANSTKPLVVLVSEEKRFPAVLEMLEQLHGDLASRPFIIPYFNPITPLVINEGTVDKMRATIDRGLPLIYSNYGMAGASTPITPAGMLTLLNAELLAGLVLSQLMKEGTPIILGMLPAYMDMRGMGNFYDPMSYVIDVACAEMMASYGLPHCGTSGSGVGWGADILAAGHQWLNHVLSCLGRAGLAPFVGDILGSTTMSPSVIVLADEIIGQARRMAAGFEIGDTEIALADIADVGPGGDFLMSPGTLANFRTAYFHSDIFPISTVDDWKQKGQPRAGDRLRSYTAELLETLKGPDDHDELIARGEEFIRTTVA